MLCLNGFSSHGRAYGRSTIANDRSLTNGSLLGGSTGCSTTSGNGTDNLEGFGNGGASLHCIAWLSNRDRRSNECPHVVPKTAYISP